MTQWNRGWQDAVRRARRRLSPKALILQYHRVFEFSSDPYLLCVTPQHFAEHMEVIKRKACLLPLQKLVQTLRDRRLPQQAVAITFDDGYVDNLYNAKPLLERCDAPATVFVASGHVDCGKEFWWDELEHLLLQPGKLPSRLRLSIQGAIQEWGLGPAFEYSEKAYLDHRGWNLGWGHDPTPRHTLFRRLYHLLHPLSTAEREVVLDQLHTWATAPRSVRLAHRTLSAREIIDLRKGDLVEIGAHTVTHPVLSSLTMTEQQAEIHRSKMHLEKIVDRPIQSFAYPHGVGTAETKTLVRESGFTSACSNLRETVWSASDPWQLPRLRVKDWDGEQFAEQLERWVRV